MAEQATGKKKGRSQLSKRPKSREETPKEGSDNARRCRTATICTPRPRNASDAYLFSHANPQDWASGGANPFQLKLFSLDKKITKNNGLGDFTNSNLTIL
jgi:hypothetical protein